MPPGVTCQGILTFSTNLEKHSLGSSIFKRFTNIKERVIFKCSDCLTFDVTYQHILILNSKESIPCHS